MQQLMSKKILSAVFIVLLSWTLKSQNNARQEHIKTRETNRASLVPKIQILDECNFFGGDTLVGFPIEAEVDAILSKYKNYDYGELKANIRNKEIAFIKNKYKIEKLPFELAQEIHSKELKASHTNSSNANRGTNPSTFASSCGNLDFEDGDFTGWQGYEGNNQNSNTPLTLVTGPILPPTNLNSAETSCNYFSILNTGTDPISGATVPSPLGGYCARLGGENRNLGSGLGGCNDTPSGSQNNTAGEVLETTFTVTTANTAFQYAFMFVYLDDGSHTNGQQPYFKIEVLDQNSNPINCLNYYQQGNNGTAPAGYTTDGFDDYYTTTWKVSSLNLLPYLNKPVTIRFTVAGCYATAHFGYAYVDCKCAPLELIIPTSVCQGQNGTLIAPPQSDGTYAWTGPSIVSGGTKDTVTVNQPGTYSVTITNQQGCSYTIDTTIAFYPNPTITVNSPTTCAGNAVTLNANSTNAGTLAYTWNPLTNLSNMQDSTVTATVNSNTSYTVTGTSVHGCTNTAVSTISTSGAPPPIFSAPPVCLGAATVINNTTGGGTFDWNFGDGTPVVTNQTSPTHTYTTSGTFVVSSTVTLTGCVGTGTANVVVNPIPTATISAPPVCIGVPTVFTSTVTNGTSYLWDYGDPVGGSAAGTATPSHTYASANTFAVTVTVTAAAPTSCTVTATTNVIVSSLPTASFSVAPVCFGTASSFDGSASTPTVGATYTWNYGDGPAVAASSTPTHTYGSAGTFPVSLLVTVGSCTASTTGSATVNPFPVLGFTADHPCDGTAMNITNTTTNQGTISGWNWNFGDGTTPSTAATPPAHTYTAAAGVSAAGCYSVVLTATASTGCTGSHDTIVYIHPNPVTSFTAVEQCLGTPSGFLDGSVVQNPACLNDQITNWSYDFGDGTTTPFTNATIPVAPADTIKHTYATCGPKNITVTITTNNGCTNSATLTGDTVFCPPTVVGPVNFTVCPGAATPVQTFTTTCVNGGNPFSVWGQYSDVTGAPASYLFDPNNLNFDVVPTYTAVASNPLCSVIQDTVFAIAVSGFGCIGNETYYIANVWPTPTVTPVSSVTVCANVSVPAFNFTGCPGTPTETFTWTATGDNVGLTSPGAGNISSFPGQNATSAVAVSTVSVTPSANGCSGPGTTFSVTVDPIPTMTVTSPNPYCPNALVSSTDYNIGTTPAGVGVTYTWTATNNAGTGMPLSGTGAAPVSSYSAPANPSQVDQIGVVTYTPSLDGCIGLPVTETVTIKPTPTMVAMADQYWCPGVMTNSVALATVPTSTASTFSWSSNAPPIGASGTSNPIPAFGPTQNPGLTTLGIAVTVTPTLNGCVGPPSGFGIFVYPTPIPKFSFTHNICDGNPINLTDLSIPNTGTITVNQWAWDMNGDGSVDASTKNPNYTYPTGTIGSIPVTLTVSTSSAPSCTAQVTENVYINPNPVVNFSGDNLKSCPTLTTNFANLTPVIVPAVNTTYSWTFGNGNHLTTTSLTSQTTQSYTNASPFTPQYYSVTLTAVTDSTCKGSLTKTNYLEVYPHPIANFSWGPSDADIDNSTIVFTNESQGASAYVPQTFGPNGVHYYLGDIYASNPNFNNHDGTNVDGDQFSHTYEHYDTATYYVTQWVINKYGCMDTITKPVYIGPNFTFYIPNAFSPNGDGVNEGFKGLGVGIDNSTYNLWVFDRWGLMIFYANDIDKTWDGHMRDDDTKPVLQEDVYVWKVKFHDFTGKLHEYHGTVTLLR
jgi:gliding motility-associated-like protein